MSHANVANGCRNIFTGLDVILMLLNFGALKSLRTGLGETAHEIAVRRGRAADIVRTLEEPRAVRDNRRAIGNIEAAVHRLMLARVGDKLRATGAQLPQLAVLWEMSNECGNFIFFIIINRVPKFLQCESITVSI